MKKITFFTPYTYQETVPEACQGVKLTLNGKMQSDLDWGKARNAALKYKEKGLQILWEIDFGLFDRLSWPLSNQMQFLSFSLSLEHFRDTLWKEFEENSLGLCLYDGTPDFSLNFPWDEEQIANLREWVKEQFVTIFDFRKETHLDLADFTEIQPWSLLRSPQGQQLASLFCRDVVGEYFDLIANRLQDGLPLFLLFDPNQVSSPLQLAQLSTKERFSRFQVYMKKMGKDEQQFILQEEGENASLGVCLPPMALCRPSHYENLEEVLRGIKKLSLSYKTIPESMLTTEWDGLDSLFVISKSLTVQGKRKLQGFCAAGGTVVTLGEKIGLPQEISFDEWKSTYNH